jgi:hypothetical protein
MSLHSNNYSFSDVSSPQPKIKNVSIEVKSPLRKSALKIKPILKKNTQPVGQQISEMALL